MSAQLKTELLLKDINFTAKLNSATKKAQASLNQIQQSTKGLSGVLGSFGGQLGSVTSQLNGLLGAASKLANPWVAAGAAIGGAAVAFFNYNKNLEQTLNRTQQFTGLTGNELNSLRNGIAATAQTFGKDFNDVLSSVDGLMSQFGISGETALNIIKDGFVAGADDSKNFLENLGKYSGAFNDIGVSADELTALLAQTRSGIFSEEGMDAILMAGKNIRTMSNSAKLSLAAIGISGDDMISKLNNGQMTTMQAIRLISGALKKLPPLSNEVGNVLQDVFGKKGSAAGYELITALEGISTNLDEVKQQTGEDGKVLEELADTTREFQNACQSLFGVTDSGFSHLTDQMKISVMLSITRVIKRFIDLYNNSVQFRRSIENIKLVFVDMWAVVKGILKSMGDALHGLGGLIASALAGDLDLAKKYWELTKNAIKKDIKAIGKDFENNKIVRDVNIVTGHIEEVKTEDSDKSEYGKTSGKGRSGGKTTGGSSKSGSKTDKKDKKVEPVVGSLGDLEKRLKDLQDKYKDGLIKITPENYQKQVKELEDKIEQKKIELKLAYDKDSVEGLEEQLKKLLDNQKSTNTELHLDTKEFYKQEAELTKKIQDKKVSLLAELDENSIDVIKLKLKDLQENLVSENVYLHLETKEFNKQEAELIKQLLDKELSIKVELDESSLSVYELELKNLEENQISENVYLHIDSEEYKKQHKELEQKIESEKIRLGVSLSLEDVDKQYKEMMDGYKKKSSFEIAVGTESINSKDYEAQLGLIQSLMDLNDLLLQQLEELKNAYEALGDAGKEGYAMIESLIASVTAEQLKLGEQATKTNELSKSQKQLIKDLNGSADAVSNFGSAFSSLGSSLESPELNVMGIIAGAIANVLLGAGKAIAEAADLGPWAWIGFGGTIMGIAASVISQMKSLGNYASGGIVPYGKNVSDKNVVHVNGGEAILNLTQLKRLWNIISGQESMMMLPAFTGGQVEFKIRGQELYGVLSNYNKKISKI